MLGVPTTSDNCTIISVLNNAPSVFPIGNTLVTWTITDAGGLTATDTQTITVIDNTSPSVVSISNTTISVDANQCSNSTYIISVPTTSDNCTVASVLSDAPATYSLGNTIVTWTVTDGVGLSVNVTQTISVIDNITPSILSPANVTLTADAGQCSSSSVVLGTPTTSDNCSIASITNNAPLTYPFGNTIVTWTITDGSGLMATCTQTVSIVDNIVPSILSPANVTVTTDVNQCGSSTVVLGIPTTSDNCTVTSVVNDGPSTYPLGNTVVTWTVTDEGGLTATSSQTVTVIDNIPPVIISAPNTTITTDVNQCVNSNYIIAVPTASDNCTIASVLSDAPTTYSLGNTIVTWTVTDGSGLMINASQTITVIDAILPTIISPSNISVYTDAGQCSSLNVLLGTPTVSDNCSVASVVNDAPSVYALGNTIVTWTVTDGNGLVSTSTQTVTVMDSIKPSIISPSNVVVYNSLASCGIVVNSIAPVSFSDNCSVSSVVYQVSGATNASGINDASGTIFNFGVSTVNYIVTDVSGNKDTSSFDVEVKNTIPMSNAGTNFTICETQQPLTLNANQATSGMLGKWTVIAGQATFANMNLENTTVSNLQTGLNTLRWTMFSSPCDSAYSEINVLVDGIPNNSSAGNNDTICENRLSYQLQAGAIITGTGLWTQITGTSSIADNTNPTTTISNYSIGSNEYVWQIINGVCLSNKDTVEVMVHQLPTAAFAGTDLMVTLPSATLAANQPVVGQASWSIVNGFGTIEQIHNPSTIVSSLSYGVNTFNWTITNGVCPSSSDDIKVEYSGLEIPNAFSPNGDGINDNFEIIGIQFFTNAKLVILNRWGSVVYENENYKNEFNGNNTSNQPLVDDTYFYVLEINEVLKYNGYLIIKREK